MPEQRIAISGDPQTRDRWARLADQYRIPVFGQATNDIDYLLYLNQQQLQLQSLKQPGFTPLYFDFVRGKNRHRRLYGGGKNQHLAKAVGLNKYPGPSVLDGTAGTGKDGFVLASLGAHVTLLERCLPVYLLLQDALQRCAASEDSALQAIAARMRLLHQDAHAFFSDNASSFSRCDIVYLDPMFPTRQKSAQVKKDMQIFHDLVGKDRDASELLPLAQAWANKRVVVKRPIKAPPLSANNPPNYQITGKNTRYDIYLAGS